MGGGGANQLYGITPTQLLEELNWLEVEIELGRSGDRVGSWVGAWQFSFLNDLECTIKIIRSGEKLQGLLLYWTLYQVKASSGWTDGLDQYKKLWISF